MYQLLKRVSSVTFIRVGSGWEVELFYCCVIGRNAEVYHSVQGEGPTLLVAIWRSVSNLRRHYRENYGSTQRYDGEGVGD